MHHYSNFYILLQYHLNIDDIVVTCISFFQSLSHSLSYGQTSSLSLSLFGHHKIITVVGVGVGGVDRHCLFSHSPSSLIFFPSPTFQIWVIAVIVVARLCLQFCYCQVWFQVLDVGASTCDEFLGSPCRKYATALGGPGKRCKWSCHLDQVLELYIQRPCGRIDIYQSTCLEFRYADGKVVGT